MAKVKLGFILAAGFLLSQVTANHEFPTIPEYYSTNILVNFFETVSPSTRQEQGFSIAAREVVDESWKRALLEFSYGNSLTFHCEVSMA